MELEFRIISPAGDEFTLMPEVPAALKQYRLATAETQLVTCRFGNMLFHHFIGDGFDIWYSNYLIEHNARIIGRADIPVLELHIPFENQFAAWWDGVGQASLKNRQFEITYTPFVNTTVEFIGGKDYHTFDIHLSKEYLQIFSPHYPILADFLEKVEKKMPSNLLGITQFLSPEVISLINKMLRYDMKDAMASLFFEGVVLQLMIYLLERLSGIDSNAPKTYSEYDIERTCEAKDIMLTNLAIKYTIKQLAKKVGLNECKLQLCFKHLFGTTIYSYVLISRMEYAKQLLLDPRMTVQEIAELVGYPDAPNLTAPFRKHFGYPPDYFRKHHKH